MIDEIIAQIKDRFTTVRIELDETRPGLMIVIWGALVTYIHADLLESARYPIEYLYMEFRNAAKKLNGEARAVHLWALNEYRGSVLILPPDVPHKVIIHLNGKRIEAPVHRFETSLGLVWAAFIEKPGDDVAGILYVDKDSYARHRTTYDLVVVR